MGWDACWERKKNRNIRISNNGRIGISLKENRKEGEILIEDNKENITKWEEGRNKGGWEDRTKGKGKRIRRRR